MNSGIKIYISYKHKDGWELARIVNQALINNGFETALKPNQQNEFFDNEIKNNINKSDLYILILSRNCLTDSIKSKDLFYKEVSYIIEQTKNSKNKTILPIIDETTFKISSNFKMPKKFDYLNSCNSIYINEKFFKDSIHTILNFIVEQEFQMFDTNLAEATNKVESSQYRRQNSVKSVWNEQKLNKMSYKERQAYLKKEIVDSFEKDFNEGVFDYETNIYQNIFKQYKKLNILDLGCSFGLMTDYFLGKYNNNVENYVGIDVREGWIGRAKMIHEKQPNHKYLALDLGKIDIDSIKKMCVDKNGKEIKFNVIICRHLLNCFKNPMSVLQIAKELLKQQNKENSDPSQKGTLIITEFDDKFSFFGDDKKGILTKFYKLVNNISNYDYSFVGNRNAGREMYTLLFDAGFRNINLQSLIYNGELATAKIRSNYELIYLYNWTYSNYQEISFIDKYSNNKDVNSALKWLKENRAAFEQQINKDDFIALISCLIWTAKL